MAAPGLSLHAFYDRNQAEGYVTDKCAVNFRNRTEANIAYNVARNRLRPKETYPRTGNPSIRDDLGPYAAHLSAVVNHPTYAWAIHGASAVYCRTVEIAPLISFQTEVYTELAAAKVAGIGVHSPLDNVLPVCLPTVVEPVNVRLAALPNGNAVLASLDLNVQVLGPVPAGIPDPYGFGLDLRVAPAFIVVARIGGLCYLKNGYHRAYGLAAIAGRQDMPCIVAEFDNYDQLQVAPGHFPKNIVLSKNPPTLGHFIDGRATAVKLHRVMRLINPDGSSAFARLSSP